MTSRPNKYIFVVVMSNFPNDTSGSANELGGVLLLNDENTAGTMLLMARAFLNVQVLPNDAK